MDTETKLDQILKIVIMVQQDVTQLKKDVVDLKKDVADLKKVLADLRKDFESLKQNEVAKLQQDVEKLKADVKSLNRSVLLIEERHGEKLRALFDAREANQNKHEEIINLCLSIKSEIQGTLFNHEKRISKLEGNLVPSF